ncbi:MAG: Abi family protein [Treponema sp.]|nr:Abi family protein [Treponema sp.]
MKGDNSKPLDFAGIVRHLREKHGLNVEKTQERALRNIGYYHGYKGYRFVRESSNKIPFSSFAQVVTLNKFDMQLKAIFYSRLMFIENALKSFVIEATLADCQSEKLSDAYKTSLTFYQSFKATAKTKSQNGKNRYKQEFKKRMDLEMRINSALIRDYMRGRRIENHYFDNDRDVPLWAAFESLTLGEFGNFFSCSNSSVKRYVSSHLGFPSNLDGDGNLLSSVIFCLKDLRNAIAHNGVIFDTRFATSRIDSRVEKLIETQLGIVNLDYRYIVAYVAVVVYLLKCLGETKDAGSFVNEYKTAIKTLDSNFDKEVYFKIVGTQEKGIVEKIESFIKSA